jgi:putative endonuclease
MATVTVGRQAEAAVGNYLNDRGYKILAYNWKMPRCEIDIIAAKNNVAYLVEVKYRGAQAQGSGFEYIGPRKLKQMEFAAKVWSQAHNWGGDIQLLAAQVSGSEFKKVSIIELG